jgi:TolB-like protein/cytochrome c-type biogenesis protein CcmH/NrfG
VPDELVRILRKCLAKSRDERYASAHDLAADLERLERAFATGDPLAGRTRPRPSIAVLPFTNMSSDPENEFFSDGLTEELLNVLAKNPAWRITGRTSSFAFKGKQEDLREIGRKLGVETLLEGSVRKAGNRVRITAQLVNATDGFHLWSETYDRVLEDIFDVQDDIAQAVAMAMNVTLLGAATPRHTPDAESHALTMRAKQAALQMSRSSMTVAVDLYRSAIERDAEYAAAWAGLARVLALSSGAGHFDSARGARESRDAADKALSLDPELAEAHEARGIIAFAFEHQLDKAGEHFRKAYELAPNNCQVLQSLALHEAVQGHFEEMLRLEAVAIELDPLNPEAYLHYARFLYWADKNVEAEAAIRRALELSPDMTSARALLLCVLVAQGRTEEAHEVGMAEPGKGYRLCVVAITHHLLGRSSQSNEALAALTDMGDQWAFQVAAVHAMRGEANEAFTWLQRALDSGDPGAPTLTIHPMLRSLHGDPRWQKMLQRVKLQA